MHNSRNVSTTLRGPLTGLRVLDFGHYYAGPMAAMLLADQGATVIRIVRSTQNKEIPEQQFRLINRNKNLLQLDLKSEEGKAKALELIQYADVLIENFRPGVMSRLGFDYPSMKSINPGLVYLSLPGFASTDTDRRHIQAWEGILAAAAGIHVNTSYVRQFLDFPPLYTSLPVNSMYGGVHGVTAVMAALLERQKHGYGNWIEASLAETGMTAFGFKFSISPMSFEGPFDFRHPDNLTSGDQWHNRKELRYFTEDSAQTQLHKLSAGLDIYWSHPFTRFYTCADGRQVHLFFPFSAVYAERFLKTIGIYQELLSAGFVNIDPSKLYRPLPNNLAAYDQMSDERKQLLQQRVSETLALESALHWEDLLADLVPCAQVRTRQEYLSEPVLLESGVHITMQSTKSTLVVPGSLVDVEGPSGTDVDRFAEVLSITPEDALMLFSRKATKKPSAAEYRQSNKGELLQGFKVLDLSNGIAGPMSSYVLAQYGANIIKLDPPPLAGRSPMMMEVGQGKQSILVDLKTAPGQQVLQRILLWADIVIHNKLDPTARRLGISREQLHNINPGLVVCQISACGGPKRDAWETRFGFDPTAQAISGLMSHYGKTEAPHWHEGTMIADSMCGYGMAFGALLGVWQKRKYGQGVEVKTSLLRASNFIQLPWMIAENGNTDWSDPRGQFAVGPQWWQRLYACSDGWIYVAAEKACAGRLVELVTGEELADVPSLEAAFIAESCATWIKKLDAADIACHRVLSISDICARGLRAVDNRETDEQALGAGEILCWREHPSGPPVIIQAPDWVRVGEKHSWKRLRPTPAFGENSAEILTQLGYSSLEINRLIDINAVRMFIPTGE